MASSISAGTTSSTALVATADTSGALVLQTNNGTTALTLSTAQNATFAGTLTTSSRGIAAASMPAGSILQVVQGTTNTQASTTSTTLVTTGLSASITPSSSTSKILVLINMGDVGSLNSGSGTNGAGFGIYRGGSAIVSNLSSQISYNAINASNLTVCGFSSTYLDSPATTSSTTYTVYFKSQGSVTTVYSFRDNTQGSITLMEIAV